MFLKNNTKIILTSLSALFLIALNIIIEMRINLEKDSLLFLRIFLVIIIIFISKNTTSNLNKLIRISLKFFIVLFILNIILNMINIYHIKCSFNEETCSTISLLFYKLKLFRFITLSSYFFTIPILLLFLIGNNSKLKLNINKIGATKKIFLILTAIYIFSNILRSLQTVYLSIIQSYQVMNENYYDRFTFKKGGTIYYGWIRVYSNFVIAQTSKDANILLPPQSDTYKMEGNINYFRWFMFPRNLFHSEDILNDESIKIEYIILSAGECETATCVWPDYQINKEQIDQILLIDRETQKIEILSAIDYIPENFYQKWGLIKLK